MIILIDDLFDKVIKKYLTCKQQKSKPQSKPAVSGYIEVLVLISIAILATSIIYVWFDSYETSLSSDMKCTAHVKSHYIYDNTHWTQIEIKNTGHTTIDYFHITHVNGSSIMKTSATSAMFDMFNGTGVQITPQQNIILIPKDDKPITLSESDVILVQAIRNVQSVFCEVR